jgi:hypothetical protein
MRKEALNFSSPAALSKPYLKPRCLPGAWASVNARGFTHSRASRHNLTLRTFHCYYLLEERIPTTLTIENSLKEEIWGSIRFAEKEESARRCLTSGKSGFKNNTKRFVSQHHHRLSETIFQL